MIYKCLTSLPKNIVSTITELLWMIKNQDDESKNVEEVFLDLNKQEENIMKIFSSSSDSSLKSHDQSILIAASIF